MLTKATIDLDRMLSACAVSDEEVELWPENRLRTLGLRDDLLQGFSDVRNGEFADDDDAKSIIDVIRFFWIRLLLSLTYNQRLAESLTEAGLSLKGAHRYPTLSAVMSGKALPDDRFLPLLASGPPRYAKWRWPIRLARQAIKKPAVRAYPWPSPGRDGEVVTFTQGHLVNALALQRDVRPRYCEFDLWFAAVDEGPSQLHRKIAELCLETGINAADDYGVDLCPEIRSWLFRQFELSATRLHAHIERLRELKTIPTELWIGSSSSFWPRTLAKEVLHRGGRVVAFDHGFGSGYFDGVDVPYSMQPFCNEFVTSAGIQSERIQDFFSDHPIPGMKEINVIPLPERTELRPDGNSARGLRSGSVSSGIGTIMLLPLPPMGELFNLTPYPDDWWVQDLNRRLLKDLSVMGFKVLVKPHPEFESSELAAIAKTYGAEMIDGRFEDRAHLADAFLFTHPLTTTLQYAVENGLAAALIDFGLVPWRNRMKAHLQRDVVMIPGWVEDDKRLRYESDGVQKIFLAEVKHHLHDATTINQ